ncbi:adenosylcobinamide-GDP ribazoletransferase [Roseovarius sp. 217]|uniref:adenosylcobinamide-GDP ribazoletransferase n=1 Tax=Roseovarius sp. (strain 217) TaxID=314264 RepID=UPI0000685E78|nr:putative Cobalamin (5'-phosphate) synthase [Roseovarius sp. 217]
MAENDKALIRFRDVPLALSLLSRLPVPVRHYERGARAAWAYPLAGVVLGGLAAFGGLVALWLGWPRPLVALLVLATPILLSGALHEDGLADTADGLWGGWDARAAVGDHERTAIIGSYGVIALILVPWGTRSGALAALRGQSGSGNVRHTGRSHAVARNDAGGYGRPAACPRHGAVTGTGAPEGCKL